MKDPGTQKAPEIPKVGEVLERKPCTDRGYWEPSETPTDFEEIVKGFERK